MGLFLQIVSQKFVPISYLNRLYTMMMVRLECIFFIKLLIGILTFKNVVLIALLTSSAKYLVVRAKLPVYCR